MDLAQDLTIFAMRAVNPGVGTCDSYTPETGCIRGPGSVLVIGDSITNQVFPGYRFGDVAPLVFAVNGMQVHDVLPRIDEIVRKSLPRAIIVALGKNDMAHQSVMTFRDDYTAMVSQLMASTTAQGRLVKPVLMTILPPERRSPMPWGDMAKLAQFNGIICNVGVSRGLPVVDFAKTYPGIAPIVTDSPYLPPGFTSPDDGLYIHPVGSSNVPLWAYYDLAYRCGNA